MMPSYVRIYARAGAWSSLLCFLFAIAACGAVSFGQAAAVVARPPIQFRITGVLVSSAGGSPVHHGHLEATLAGSGRMAGQHISTGDHGADTDDQGRFVISLPTAGMWDLTASARGFVRQGYRQHDEFATAVVLTNAAPAMDIRFAISPNAEISGVVTDEAGEAVRGAQVSLMKVLAEVPGHAEPATVRSSFATTDDRGMYEFDDLVPGSYRLCVQAQPWYAVAAGHVRNDRDPPLDPSLDVAYPATWFPGVGDPDAAEILAVKGGDVKEADVRMTPVPSVHILVDPPPRIVPGVSRGVPFMPVVQRVDSGTGPIGFFQPTMMRNSQGQIDVGGLTPGLYEVQVGGPGGESKRSVVRVTANGAQTVGFDAASGEAEVSLHIDGITEMEAGSLPVALIDLESRRVVATSNTSGFRQGFARMRGASARAGSDARSAREHTQTLNVPAGRYEVVIQGRPDLYLAGITAKGAQATGRAVTLPAGESSLTLHVAEGRASLTGFATLKGKPSVGSVVMLVPATLGETDALQIVRRDQSNSDGSFNIAQIIPGQYILIAVENGWEINWADAETLRRYLTGGVPVVLSAGSDVKQDVVAQEP